MCYPCKSRRATSYVQPLWLSKGHILCATLVTLKGSHLMCNPCNSWRAASFAHLGSSCPWGQALWARSGHPRYEWAAVAACKPQHCTAAQAPFSSGTGTFQHRHLSAQAQATFSSGTGTFQLRHRHLSAQTAQAPFSTGTLQLKAQGSRAQAQPQNLRG